MSGMSFEAARIQREAAKTAFQHASDAFNNEQLTRARVQLIEDLLRRPFLGRLLWLFLGR